MRSDPAGFDAVLKSAQSTAVNGVSLGQPSIKVENKTFIVNFTAASINDRLAIFSDDGCDVAIRDVTTKPVGVRVNVLAARGSGQALPNLLQSLHRLSFAFVATHTYQITIDYSNVNYTPGGSDIDGLSLYAYTSNANPGNGGGTGGGGTGGGGTGGTNQHQTVTLNADHITDKTAHLYWTKVTDSDFQSYSLFFSTAPLNAGNLANATKRVSAEANRDATEYNESGLTAETKYYYALRVRYTDNSTQDVYKEITTSEAAVPQLKFTTALRACAGHINTDIHKVIVVIPATIKDATGNEVPARNTKFTLTFENNTMGDKGARFLVMENGKEVEKEQIEVTSTNVPGAGAATVSFIILSSNVIGSSVQVKATYIDDKGNSHDAGSSALDFARVRLGDALAQQPGWVFSKKYVVTPQNGGLTLYTGKTYLSFAKDGGFVPVEGHTVRIKIGNITAAPKMSAPPQTDATLFFCDANGKPMNAGTESGPEATDVVTGSDGAVTFYFKAGPQIMQASQVQFKVVEKTQING